MNHPITSVPVPAWWDPGQENQLHQRKGQQVAKIRAAFQADGVQIRLHPDDNNPDTMEFMYQPRLLVRTGDDVTAVLNALGQPASAASHDNDRLPRLSSVALPDNLRLTDALAQIQGVTGRSDIASPDYVVHVCGNSGSCPATEPVPTDAVDPSPKRSDAALAHGAGDGVRVVVVDTGLLAGVANQRYWLKTGVEGKEEKPGPVGHYRGHGTFVAGVIRAIAPKVAIQVQPLLYRRGAFSEGELVRELAAALDFDPHIISISAGTTTLDGDAGVGFEAFHEELAEHHPDTLVVAAAGNDKSDEHFYPASFPWAVGVGALNPDNSRAGYSNFGDSADVYAQGTDLVNAYPNGNYHHEEAPLNGHPVTFTDRMAVWAGTSFSTPLVTGLIATRMSVPGQPMTTAAAAWSTLKAKAAARIPNSGYPYLLPDD